MPITRKKKEEILGKITEGLKTSGSAVFVNFHGLLVGEVTELRKALRENGISYAVAKKTLARKAFAEQGYKGEIPDLSGELAIAWGSDQIAPAREVNEFEKKFKDKVKILGGVFEGEFKDRDGMKAIATIPSREVLLSQIAYLLKSPMQRLAIGVSEVAKKKA
ncbi:MAG: 50S ribosomal protein L10 [Candidatus Paceibacterota bacterium]|jgi:large subunit ribosomal protein L10